MKKITIILAFLLLLSPTLALDEETFIPMSGDEELYIGVIAGDAELGVFNTIIIVPTVSTGGLFQGQVTAPEITVELPEEEKEVKRFSEEELFFICIILVVLLILFLLSRRRKKK